MAHETLPEAATAPRTSASKSSESDERENWFTRTPDLWAEVVKMEHGGDRTFASTAEQMVFNAEPSERVSLEKSLLSALTNPQLRPAGRLFLCRMLGLIGTASSVPTLTRLLNENETSDLGRLALDQIDDPRVNEAYRAALARLSGAAKAGLIGSLAMRRDRASLDLLRAIAQDSTESAEVRVAATHAVERLTGNA